MARYAAFLRGVSPTNAKMPELKKAFEAAGFTDVRTVLSSGNVVFTARKTSDASLQRIAEEAMRDRLGQAFLTIVRPIDALAALLATDPYRPFRVGPTAKRIVTFLRDAAPRHRSTCRSSSTAPGCSPCTARSSSARTSRPRRGPSS